MRGRLLALSALLIGSLAPLSAAAKPSPWHMEVEFVTEFPMHVGAHITLDMPHGLQVSTAIGDLPGPFVGVINGVVRAFGGYGKETADLVEASLRDSLVWRLHVGWQPFDDLGFYVAAGYGLVTLGSYVRGDTVVTVLEDDVRDQLNQLDPEFEDHMKRGRYDVYSTLHMLDAEIGWRWILESGWSFRVALGVAATINGYTDVTADSTVLRPEHDDIVTRGTQHHLDTIYRKHVHTPVITFGFGHRLF